MQIGSTQWCDLIIEGAAHYGIRVSTFQVSLFAQHASALLEWNRKTNLTAIVEPIQVAVKHYLDAIIAVNYLPAQGAILDLGTGAGFPGIPLKILRPDQPMTLIDGSRKKISFVKSMIRQLGLSQVAAIQARSEELAKRSEFKERFAVVVSRAVAKLDQIVLWSAGLIAPGGHIILYQGPKDKLTTRINGEIESSINHQIQVIAYRLPLLDEPRTLVIIESSF